MQSILLRTLLRNDLDAVAAIHHNAFPASALADLGGEAVRRYYKWQMLGPHDAIALGIFQGEKLAGYCFAGVFHNALSGFLHKNRSYLIWRILTHPWLMVKPFIRERIRLALMVLKRRSILAKSPQRMPSKSFGILAIAVDPQNQGAGLGKRLMTETESIAIERDFSRLHLTVDIKNIQAIAFYQDLDWQQLPESDGVWRGAMAKTLASYHD